jgi:hypothetical protein
VQPTILQIQQTQDGSVHSTTAIIPLDNTTPQITEGAQVQSLSFTPKKPDSKIKFEWKGFLSNDAGGGVTAALFQSGATGALDAYVNSAFSNCFLTATMDSWGTSARTISARFGARTTGTAYVGSSENGTDTFNGVIKSVLTVTEYKN